MSSYSPTGFHNYATAKWMKDNRPKEYARKLAERKVSQYLKSDLETDDMVKTLTDAVVTLEYCRANTRRFHGNMYQNVIDLLCNAAVLIQTDREKMMLKE